MSDTITLYYYTAWDGFAWQGCDEATAKSLQGYMEATKTLPKSSADEPPFGGAVPCKIAGKIGVAVYRYMTREKGDLSGRDCLYIALAFIPLDVGCVDFAKLLELPQLNTTQKGELRPQNVSVSEHGLRVECTSEVPDDWLDSGITGTTYATLRGREGLLTLSRLFFSTHTQLGFLNAVFRLEAGNTIVSSQTYSVYPEVLKVVAASEELRKARALSNGVLPNDHKAVCEMKSALCELDTWASKQRGYPGLRAYHDKKKLEMSDAGDRIREISRYMGGLNRAWDPICNIDPSEARSTDGNTRQTAEHCLEVAKGIESLPIIDDESYGNAVKLSVEALCRSAELLGAMSGIDRAVQAEKSQKEAENQLKELSLELGRTKSEADGLKAQLEKKESEIEKLKKKIQSLESKQDGGEASPDDGNRSIWEWALAIMAISAILLISAVAIYFVKNGDGSDKDKTGETKVIIDSAGWGGGEVVP